MKKHAPGTQTAQFQTDTTEYQGRSMTPPSLNISAGPIQKQNAPPSGRSESTEFGEYWVVPDGTVTSVADAVGEQITETEFANLQTSWTTLKNGTGSVLISENDSAGVAHAGFKTKMITQFGKLMSQPVGRGIVVGLLSATNSVTIRPSASQIYGGANAIRGGTGTLENADGSAGSGDTTIIQIDADLSDTDIVVYDAAGNEISDPVFIILGHELIHAVHNNAGRNRRNLPSTDAAYGNREEQEAIETGSPTEADLRTEHGLDIRHGHSGRDTR